MEEKRCFQMMIKEIQRPTIHIPKNRPEYQFIIAHFNKKR